jgi:dTDP-4-amino-4,6-dideoxygalactose transaminase
MLAIDGGVPYRDSPMPARLAFGSAEEAELMSCIKHYRSMGQDPPYSGRWNQLFSEAFAEYQGGGHAFPVSSGTGAIYVAVAALELPRGSVVLTSPVTCSGVVGVLNALNLVPKVVDSAPDSLNVDVERVADRLDDSVRAIVVTHAGGEPVDVGAIMELVCSKNVAIVEDCSQATGASLRSQKVGTWGHVAAFSTMYRKNLAAGASSGLVYTRDFDLYRRALSYSDRGKPLWRLDLNLRDPGNAFFAALNWNSSEMSNAIGLASLRRLDQTIHLRRAFLRKLIVALDDGTTPCTPYAFHDGFSPFYFPIFVDPESIRVSVERFAQALEAEGVTLGAKYGCIINTWPWAETLLADRFVARNALSTRDRSFNLHLNENYEDQEVSDIIGAINKVATAYRR